jgi:protein-S-isoprenylcysteine O-methyltransferase Ste14
MADAPAFVRRLAALNHHLGKDVFGGPRVLKHAWIINAQKGGTLFFVGALMFWYGDFSAAAFTYLGLHGAYGVSWLLKDRVSPDPGWETKVTFGGALMSFLLVLGPYWLAPVLLISDVLGAAKPQPTNAILGAAIFIHTLGVVIMMVSDAQKFFTLKHKRGLIQDGMFARVRHPNYLGEMMLYGSYALIVGHWIPWVVLGFVWLQLFLPNMLMKEASMSRYPEWAEYRRRTGFLLPKLVRPASPAKV